MGKTVKGYKGFNPGMVCRGKQYAENTVFEEEKASLCESGIHYCTDPLDVLNYYPILDDNCNVNEYAEVEDLEPQEGQEKESNSKRCTKKIRIGGKVSVADLFKASFDIEKIQNDVGNSLNDQDRYSAQIGSSGDYAQIGSSGDSAKIGSSGFSAKIGSSGYSAQIGSSGYSAQIGSSGKYAVIMCAGAMSRAKGKIGSWITLSEWKNRIPVAVVTKRIDGVEIKEDTWYELKDGQFSEVEI